MATCDVNCDKFCEENNNLSDHKCRSAYIENCPEIETKIGYKEHQDEFKKNVDYAKFVVKSLCNGTKGGNKRRKQKRRNTKKKRRNYRKK